MNKLLSNSELEWFDHWYSELEYGLAPKYKRPADWQERALKLLQNNGKRNICCTSKEGLTKKTTGE